MKKLLFTILFSMAIHFVFGQSIEKNRVIILSDIEADPDDTQSFVRLLLYSNVIDIKGMVATTSCWQKNRIAPESIKKIIQAYGKVQTNLLIHEPGFPDSDSLLTLVKVGLPVYGMLGVGEGKDSEGSDWIIKELEKNDERPLWISAWGGANTLAQSLFKIKKTKSASEAKRLIAKLRVYTISDQDDSGIWMRNNFPELFYIVSPGDEYGTSTWSAINSVIKGIDNSAISNTWITKNLQQGHGPLGAIFPDVSWGVEGDTPAFLSLIPNGLNDAEHPEWGGWGGRYEFYKPDFSKQKKGSSGVPFEAETRAIWTNATDHYIPLVYNEYGRIFKPDTISFTDNKVSLWRWRADFQNDFAARMDWCLSDYREANHAPVPVINVVSKFTVRSGEQIFLNAADSYDPDGDNISTWWFHYPEAGTYQKEIIIQSVNYPSVTITAPDVTKKETVHLILKVTDKGMPALTRYKRIIVTVLPK